MPLQRCLIIQFAIAAVIVLAVGALNWAVDPFGLFGNNRHGFFFSSERQIKQGLTSLDDRSGIVMGSSKVAEIDPDLIAATTLLNSAWSGALPEEMLYFLRERGSGRAFAGGSGYSLGRPCPSGCPPRAASPTDSATQAST